MDEAGLTPMPLTPEGGDRLPPMPGKDGPTYSAQICCIETWMPPPLRPLYDTLNWRQDPTLVYSLFLRARRWCVEAKGQIPPENDALHASWAGGSRGGSARPESRSTGGLT